MANTFSQIYLHFVFAVSQRECAIDDSWRLDLYKYLVGSISRRGNHVVAIGGMPDHVHILVSMSPSEAPSVLVQQVKMQSSKWINEKQLTPKPFKWQTGYGCFSYTKSHVSAVVTYIKNQRKHHSTQGFLDEFRHILENLEIPHEDIYLFDEI